MKDFEGEPSYERKRSHFAAALAHISIPPTGTSPALLFHRPGNRIYGYREDARADVVELSRFKPDSGRGAVYGQSISDPRRSVLADSGRSAVVYRYGVEQPDHSG